MEVWKDIPGYEGRYQASSAGNIRSLDRVVTQRNRWGDLMDRIEHGKVLALCPDRYGYMRVMGRELPTPMAHRLVAMAFIPNPQSLPQINHKNGFEFDNRPENLEWCTNSQNHIHAVKVLGRKPNRSGMKRTVLKGRNGEVRAFPSAADAAAALGVAKTAITNAIRKGFLCQGYEVAYV